MRYYNDLMSNVPPYSTSISLILHCILEQVVANENHVFSCEKRKSINIINGLKDSEPNLEKVLEEIDFTEDHFESCEPDKFIGMNKPAIISQGDDISRRTSYLLNVHGFNPNTVELYMLQLFPTSNFINSSIPEAQLEKSSHFQYIRHLEQINISEVLHFVRLIILESLELLKVNNNGELDTSLSNYQISESFLRDDKFVKTGAETSKSLLIKDDVFPAHLNLKSFFQNLQAILFSESSIYTKQRSKASGKSVSSAKLTERKNLPDNERPRLSLTDIKTKHLFERKLTEWNVICHYQENHVLLQVIAEANYLLPITTLYKYGVGNMVLVALHNPYSDNLMNVRKWKINILTDVHLRDFVEHIQDMVQIPESVIQEKTFLANHQLKNGINKPELKVDENEQNEHVEEATYKGYAMGHKLLKCNSKEITLFPSDGGQIRIVWTQLKNEFEFESVTILKDSHVFSIHITTYEDPKIGKMIVKEESGQSLLSYCSTFTAQFADGMMLSFQAVDNYFMMQKKSSEEILSTHIKGTVTEKEEKIEKQDLKSKFDKSIKKKKSSAKLPMSTVPSIINLISKDLEANFQKIMISCPDGLCLDFSLETVEDNDIDVYGKNFAILVRQSYLEGWISIKRTTSVREMSRSITYQGIVIKTYDDKTVKILYGDGMVISSHHQVDFLEAYLVDHMTHFQDYKNVPSEEIFTIWKLMQQVKIFIPNDLLPNQVWIITLPMGKRYLYRNNQTLEMEPLLCRVFKTENPEERLVIREDNVILICKSNHVNIAEHTDGTRITRVISSSEEDTESFNEASKLYTFITIECPGFARVIYKNVENACEIDFRSGSKISIQVNGTYRIKHRLGGCLDIFPNTHIIYTPKSEIWGEKLKNIYNFWLNKVLCCSHFDSMGNLFEVFADATTNVNITNPIQSSDKVSPLHNARFFMLFPKGSGGELVQFKNVKDILDKTEKHFSIITEDSTLKQFTFLESLKDINLQCWGPDYITKTLIPLELQQDASNYRKKSLTSHYNQFCLKWKEIVSKKKMPNLQMYQFIEFNQLTPEIRKLVISTIIDKRTKVENLIKKIEKLRTVEIRSSNELLIAENLKKKKIQQSDAGLVLVCKEAVSDDSKIEFMADFKEGYEDDLKDIVVSMIEIQKSINSIWTTAMTYYKDSKHSKSISPDKQYKKMDVILDHSESKEIIVDLDVSQLPKFEKSIASSGLSDTDSFRGQDFSSQEDFMSIKADPASSPYIKRMENAIFQDTKASSLVIPLTNIQPSFSHRLSVISSSSFTFAKSQESFFQRRLSTPSKACIVTCYQEHVDFGQLKDGFQYRNSLYLSNTTSEAILFTIPQPPQNIGLNIYCQKKTIEPNELIEVILELMAKIDPDSVEEKVQAFTHLLEINYENFITYVPITATILSTKEHERRGYLTPLDGAAKEVKILNEEESQISVFSFLSNI